MGLGSVQGQVYIRLEHGPCARRRLRPNSVQMVRAHGDRKQQGKRTMGLPRENNRMSIQGRSQNRVGFDGNPLGSDAKPEAMPEGGVEPE